MAHTLVAEQVQFACVGFWLECETASVLLHLCYAFAVSLSVNIAE